SRAWAVGGGGGSPSGHVLADAVQRNARVLGTYGVSGATNRPVLYLHVVDNAGAPISTIRAFHRFRSLAWSKNGRVIGSPKLPSQPPQETRVISADRSRIASWSALGSANSLASPWVLKVSR